MIFQKDEKLKIILTSELRNDPDTMMMTRCGDVLTFAPDAPPHSVAPTADGLANDPLCCLGCCCLEFERFGLRSCSDASRVDQRMQSAVNQIDGLGVSCSHEAVEKNEEMATNPAGLRQNRLKTRL